MPAPKIHASGPDLDPGLSSRDPKAYAKRVRELRKAAGLCTSCCKPRGDCPSASSCAECLRKCRERQRKRFRLGEWQDGGGYLSRRPPGETKEQRLTRQAEEDKQRARDRAAKRRAAGVCYQCGKAPAAGPGEGQCVGCRDADAADWQERLAGLRRDGTCAFCGRRPAEPDKTGCRECLGQINRLGAERYRRLKQQGLCGHCGKEPPRPGCVCCAGCAAKQKGANKRMLARRREAGLCPCGSQTDPGWKTCTPCRTRGREREAQYRARRKAARESL